MKIKFKTNCVLLASISPDREQEWHIDKGECFDCKEILVLQEVKVRKGKKIKYMNVNNLILNDNEILIKVLDDMFDIIE